MISARQNDNSAEKLIKDIKAFIKLSFNGDESSINNWAREVSSQVESFCYIRTQCNHTNCLSYKSDCGRCWLQVGTMCGGEIQGKFADKFELCTECGVYQEYVGLDPISNLRELVFTLVHSINLRKQELRTALDEVQTLRGLIPICSSCKNIRDDKGSWNRIESYITEHSEAEFTHSYCNDCLKKLYPEIADQIVTELTGKGQ